MCQKWIDVILVQEASPLRLGKNEIREEEEADPAIEWEPGNPSSQLAILDRAFETVYQPIIKNVQDSAHMMTESTTQYINHGASCEGSDERRALKEAKTGKKIVMTEL
jgi:hypothetical protein